MSDEGPPPDEGVARLLERWSRGDPQALHELTPILYGELHRLAGAFTRRERTGHTLQATAVLHEAYVRLSEGSAVRFADRAHFLAIAGRVMRQVLIDYSRKRGRAKRGGDLQRVTLGEAAELRAFRQADLLALDDALTDLAAVDRLKAAIVELRYFGGLTIEETAEALRIAPKRVCREWRRARAWLYCELRGKDLERDLDAGPAEPAGGLAEPAGALAGSR
ncbi:MAG: ECF-type sigma factor [Acidobacteriota bacterium]